MMRQFLHDAWARPTWDALCRSSDSTLAGLAGKAVKETSYHLRHARSWVIRLGDGTEESHLRMQSAASKLWKYKDELFEVDAVEQQLIRSGVVVMDGVGESWTATVAETFREATLELPEDGVASRGGRDGEHGEHLSYLLGEMQVVARGASGSEMVSPEVSDAQGNAADAESERLWDLIASVEDPELPHVTLGDLGIVRSVEVTGGRVQIVLTPTFVGCPALEQIKDDVVSAVERAGLEPSIDVSLTPAWTTDWITDVGRRKLAQAGIAPPSRVGSGDFLVALDRPVACPRCGSFKTKRHSDFGATACKAPYTCQSCSEPFEGFKPL